MLTTRWMKRYLGDMNPGGRQNETRSYGCLYMPNGPKIMTYYQRWIGGVLGGINKAGLKVDKRSSLSIRGVTITNRI